MSDDRVVAFSYAHFGVAVTLARQSVQHGRPFPYRREIFDINVSTKVIRVLQKGGGSASHPAKRAFYLALTEKPHIYRNSAGEGGPAGWRKHVWGSLPEETSGKKLKHSVQ